MAPSSASRRLHVTFYGRDTPGITSRVAAALARHGCSIHDLGQAVVSGRLSLSVICALKDADPDSLLKDLLFEANQLGLRMEWQALDEETRTGIERARPYHAALTLIADHLSSSALQAITSVLASQRVNIDEITRLSENDFSCLELAVSSPVALDSNGLKKALLEAASREGIDLALQNEGLFRRSKRLIVFDLDSTLIRHEVIDEFARERGCLTEVQKLTEAAMRGELDYSQTLIERVKLLQGLTEAQIDRVYDRIELTPGAEELVAVVRALGFKTAVISGGFSCIADRIQSRLKLDYAYSNHLEMREGKATGAVTPPIVDAARKAELLKQIAKQEGILIDQVIAVGDGANDIPMLETAGLGIAFNAKPKVRERATLALNQPSLRSILYLLGLSSSEWERVSAR